MTLEAGQGPSWPRPGQARPQRPAEERAPTESGSLGWLLGRVWGEAASWPLRKRGPGAVSLGAEQGGHALPLLDASTRHPSPNVWMQMWRR